MTWGILVPQPGIEACSFNHWATRGVLGSIILDLKKEKVHLLTYTGCLRLRALGILFKRYLATHYVLSVTFTS